MDVFGRLEILDERDADYPLSAAIPAEMPGITYRYWNDNQWWGNQGSRPWCVAFAWMHLMEDGPVTYKHLPPPFIRPSYLYSEAQKVDQWPGENYDGTSVRAGAKILQREGYIGTYSWATDVDTIVRAILTTSPVVVGTRWYAGMSRPAVVRGKPVLKPTGELRGGHAYVLNGVNVNKEMFRVKNSWSRTWGSKGRALISFEDMQTLLNQQGEACMASEVKM